jgi:hypothetical protein
LLPTLYAEDAMTSEAPTTDSLTAGPQGAAEITPFENFLRSPFTVLRLPGRPPMKLATDRVRAKPAVWPQVSMMIGMTAIGLGTWGALFPRSVKRTLGIPAPLPVIRAVFGARELWSGYSLAGDPTRTEVLWARVAADAFDLAVLGALSNPANPKRGAARLWLGLVAGITALDVATALKMSSVRRNCA